MTYGHGCPQVHFLELPRSSSWASLRIGRLNKLCPKVYGLSLILVWLTFGPTASSPAQSTRTFDESQAVQCEFRVVWGGPNERKYDGQIEIDRGSLLLKHNLCLEAESIGSLRQIGASTLRIQPHRSTRFGGADLAITGQLDSTLTFNFINPSTNQPEQRSVRLQEVLQGTWVQPIDQSGNSLAIERQISDKLRVDTNRKSMIFDSGELLNLSVSGMRIGLPAGDYTLRARMVDSDNTELADIQKPVQLDDQGSFAAQAFEFQIPQTDGVRHFEVSLRRKTFINSLVSTSAAKTRRVDFVVINSNSGYQKIRDWLPVVDFAASQIFYSAANSWLPPLGNVPDTLGVPPQWQIYHPLTANLQNAERGGRLGIRELNVAPQQNGLRDLLSVRTTTTTDCLAIGADSWVAIPLRGLTPHMPYRLQIEVPTDLPMDLVASIRNVDSRVNPAMFHPDFGLTIGQREPSANSPTARHEMIFWGPTEDSYLLVANPSATKPAYVSHLYFESANFEKSHLSVAAPTTNGSPYENNASQHNNQLRVSERMVGLILTEPTLADSFSVNRAQDPLNGRRLESWATQFEAAERLEAYMDWEGYNTLVFKAFSEGAGFVPSETLHPTPRYDNSQFFSDGRSLERIDTLELLLRRFDRSGKRLVLSIDLNATLEKLVRWETNSNSPGLFQEPLRDSKSNDAPSSSNKAYNPLDARVQTELIAIVRELATRYGRHRSFAGIEFEIDSDCHLVFRGDRWGYDSQVLSEFERVLQAKLPTGAQMSSEANAANRAREQALEQFFSGTIRLRFLRWRAEELAKLYGRMAQTLRGTAANAKLYLNTLPLVQETPSNEDFFYPSTLSRNPAEQLIAHGIDPVTIYQFEHVVLNHGEVKAPWNKLETKNWLQQHDLPPGVDAQTVATSAATKIHRPERHTLQLMETISGVGQTEAARTLHPHTTRLGVHARQDIIEQLFLSDTLSLARGGWVPVTGPASEVRPIFDTLKKFPPIPLRDIKAEISGGSNLRIRSVAYEGKTYLQLVNNAPWVETINLGIRSSAINFAAYDLLTGDETQIDSAAGWDLSIEPFSLLGYVIDGEQFEILSVARQSQPKVIKSVNAELEAVESLIAQAADPTQQRSLADIAGDFETWSEKGIPLGWNFSSLPGVVVKPSRELPRSGKFSLALENQNREPNSGWIQSRSFAPPSTGRMAVRAWFRAPATSAAMHVRLSVIGRLANGERFARAKDFGRLVDPNSSIPNDWGRRPVELHVSDIPTDELNEIHVAIDLIGEGTIYVDDIQVFEAVLHPDERIFLSGQVLVAKQKLQQGNAFVAEQLLDSDWGQYLLRQNERSALPLTTASKSEMTYEQMMSPAGGPNAQAENTSANQQTLLQQWRSSLRGRWNR